MTAKGYLKLQSSPDRSRSDQPEASSPRRSGFAAAFAGRDTVHIAGQGHPQGRARLYCFGPRADQVRTDHGGLARRQHRPDRTPQLFYRDGNAGLDCSLPAADRGTVFGFWYRARNRAIMEQTSTTSKRDQLTGFMLKSALLDDDRLQGCAMPSLASRSRALILCELTGAPAIARTHGQHTEEQVIRRPRARLRLLPEDDILASAGRGSFLVFCREGIRSDAGAEPRQATSPAGSRKIDHRRHEDHAVRCHSGIALERQRRQDRRTPHAQRRTGPVSAREQGRPATASTTLNSPRTRIGASAVQRAVASGRRQKTFRLDFQPVYNIRTGELNGFEALIRLHDRRTGHRIAGRVHPHRRTDRTDQPDRRLGA